MTPTPRWLEAGEFDAWARHEPVMFGMPASAPGTLALRAVLEPSRTLVVDDGDAGIVATTTSFPKQLTLPGGARPTVAAVSCVGVSPTHRRRGLGTAVLVEQLRSVREAGEPAAVLNASEATIYGRFGYGRATSFREVTVPTHRAAFHPGVPEAEGRLRLVGGIGPASTASLARAYERMAAGLPGEISRSAPWWDLVLSEEPSWFAAGRGHHIVVHESAEGAVDGYVQYRVEHGSSVRLHVRELVAAEASVEAALWRCVLDHDLVEEVVAPLPERSGLRLWLIDPRAARTTRDADYLWVRPLDVPTLLDARATAVEDTLVIEVADRLLAAVSGRWRVTGVAGRLHLEATGSPPDLIVTPVELGEAVLGEPRFRDRVRAGMLVADPEVAARADAMFGWWPRPWCWTRF